MSARPDTPPVADPEWYLRPPHTVYYAATYDCRSYCAYCNLHTMVKVLHGGHRRARAREMDLPTVRRLLDEARAVGVALFKIGGGEPFDRADMYDIIAHGVGVGLALLPVTRHVFSREEAARLQATGLRSIAVSVDSLRPDTNRRLHRRPRSGAALLESVARLAQCGLHPYVTVVITRANVDEYEELIAAFRGCGARSVSPTMLTGPTFALRSGDAGPFDRSLCIARDAQRAVEESLLRINARYGMPSQIPDVPRPYPDVCPSADMAVVGPDGSVCYCGQTTDLFLGNVAQRTLMDVWTSPERRRLLRPTRELYAGTACATCPYFDACNQLGRCYFATIAQGPFHRPEPGRLCARVRPLMSAEARPSGSLPGSVAPPPITPAGVPQA